MHYLIPFSRYSEKFVECRRFSPTPPAFGTLVGGDLIQISSKVWQQKSRVPELLCGTVRIIIYVQQQQQRPFNGL